jgi:hypothetical protein
LQYRLKLKRFASGGRNITDMQPKRRKLRRLSGAICRNNSFPQLKKALTRRLIQGILIHRTISTGEYEQCKGAAESLSLRFAPVKNIENEFPRKRHPQNTDGVCFHLMG